MTADELSPAENRITRGCDQLGRSCAAWLTATDLPTAGRTRAALGRATGGALSLWFAGGLAYELGPIAWTTAGVLTALSVWVAGAPDEDATGEDGEDEAEPDNDGEQALDADIFTELVHDVADGGNVHLTAIGRQLAEETGREWDVLALCRAAGIPTKAVRVPGADPPVTTGIHRTDLPALPHPLSTTPVGVVSAGQRSNNNSNNVSVEEIGQGAGLLIKTGPSTRQAAI